MVCILFGLPMTLSFHKSWKCSVIEFLALGICASLISFGSLNLHAYYIMWQTHFISSQFSNACNVWQDHQKWLQFLMDLACIWHWYNRDNLSYETLLLFLLRCLVLYTFYISDYIRRCVVSTLLQNYFRTVPCYIYIFSTILCMWFSWCHSIAYIHSKVPYLSQIQHSLCKNNLFSNMFYASEAK